MSSDHIKQLFTLHFRTSPLSRVQREGEGRGRGQVHVPEVPVSTNLALKLPNTVKLGYNEQLWTG